MCGMCVCVCVQPLLECVSELKGRAVDIEIKESFMREYQVKSSHAPVVCNGG